MKLSVLSPGSKILEEFCENIMKERLMKCFVLSNHTKMLTKEHFRLTFSTKVQKSVPAIVTEKADSIR